MQHPKIELEQTDRACECAHHLAPREPLGHTVRLLSDGTQLGFYCVRCLPGMIEAMIATQANAAVMQATTKVGDTVEWSGVPFTVSEINEHGVKGDPDGWIYGWEVLHAPQEGAL